MIHHSVFVKIYLYIVLILDICLSMLFLIELLLFDNVFDVFLNVDKSFLTSSQFMQGNTHFYMVYHVVHV